MNLRQHLPVAGLAVLFFPVCIVVYHVTTVFAGTLAEPIVAPTPPFVVIDHFHIEVYLEALFLAASLLFSVPRALVWGVGVLGIPTLPIWFAIWNRDVPSAFLPGRTLLQDVVLWSLEGVAAGVVACAAWEVARRVSRRPGEQERPSPTGGGAGGNVPPNEAMHQSARWV